MPFGRASEHPTYLLDILNLTSSRLHMTYFRSPLTSADIMLPMAGPVLDRGSGAAAAGAGVGRLDLGQHRFLKPYRYAGIH